MKVSELKTLLNTFDDNDEVYYELNLSPFTIAKYLGQVVILEGEGRNLETDYEGKRQYLDDKEQQYQRALDEIKDKKSKQKPKNN